MDHRNRIVFQKPDLENLTRHRTVVDMHFHTRYSDGGSDVHEIAARARELGIGVAITDHNEIAGAVEISRCKNVLSIPGIEVTSSEGSHILIYFYDVKSLQKFYARDVRPFMGPSVMHSISLPMEEIIARAKGYRSLTIFAHPFSAAFTGVCNFYFPGKRLDAILQQADGVEAINASNLTKWNLRCALLAFNLNKAVTGGSDGHSLKHLGRTVTYAACRGSRRAFLDAVKQGRSKVVGKEIDLLRKVASNGVKLKSNLKNTPDLLEKNIRYGYTVINSKSKTLRERMRRHFHTKNKGVSVADR